MGTFREDQIDQNSGDVGSSTWINLLPRGRLGRVTITSNSSGTTTTEVIGTIDITNLPAGRKYHIHGVVTVRSDINGGASARVLWDGTQIQRKNIDTLAAGSDQTWPLSIEIDADAGDHTLELVTGVSGTDGNTVTAIANGATGTHGVNVMYFDDVGAAD